MSAPAGRWSAVRRAAVLAPMLVAGLLAASPAAAGPVVIDPAADTAVLERLPMRRVAPRRGDGARVVDLDAALRTARSQLAQAHRTGDARLAGLALGALAPWQGDAAPAAVHAVRAQALQYLHEFDAAMTALGDALSREPTDTQSWLTLASVLRVRGLLDQAERACLNARTVGARAHGEACLAELQALRSPSGEALARLTRLRAEADGDPALAWTLAVSIAELRERQGDDAAAIAAWRDALAASSIESAGYARIGLALALGRTGAPDDALRVLAAEPDTDTALMARALIAAGAGRTTQARRLAADLRGRQAEAQARPGDGSLHLREYARVALEVDRDAPRAWTLAARNAGLQREPVDLLVLARAAAALGTPQALAQAREIVAQTGVRDPRVEAALARR